jgi:hypothetical protein
MPYKTKEPWWIVTARLFSAAFVLMYAVSYAVNPFLPENSRIERLPIGLLYFSFALLSVDILASTVKGIVFNGKRGVTIEFKEGKDENQNIND